MKKKNSHIRHPQVLPEIKIDFLENLRFFFQFPFKYTYNKIFLAQFQLLRKNQN